MPVANHNSSYITLRRQQSALYAFNNQLQTAKNAGLSVQREQTNTQTSGVIVDRKQGECVCGSANAYLFNPNTIVGNAQ